MRWADRLELAGHVVLRSPVLGLVAAFLVGCVVFGVREFLRELDR